MKSKQNYTDYYKNVMTDEFKDDFTLQYVFLMDRDGRIITCDESGRNFLKRIDDFGTFYAQLQSVKINSAITNTTVMIKNRSFNLKMVPTSLQAHTEYFTSDGDNTEYIIILQDQFLFSYVFQKLNQNNPDDFKNSSKFAEIQDKLNSIFNSSNGGVFITNSKGIVIFANNAYVNATGIELEKMLGKKISDLGKSGLLDPLIAPTILETHKNLTTLQKLGTGKFAVISGSPLYDSSGNPFIIITCVNVITKIAKADSPDQYYDPSSIKFNTNKRQKEPSIDIIAESQIMKTILQEAVKVARYDVTIILLGESGVGKEVIASIIHASSNRNNEKFVRLNCSSITPNLLESELFGYEAGSFTGALSKGKLGLFEIANNGSLLLDEIGDMPIDLQSKLLRVIQSHEFYRIGGTSPINSNVRIIASTNKKLEHMMQNGLFREDLFYRLNTISIEIPPLRERKEDIKPLLLHFCYCYNRKYGTNKQFSMELIRVLEEYHWPGNIRELQNLVERLVILCIEDTLLPEHLFSKYKLSSELSPADSPIQINRLIPLKEAINIVEKELVSKAIIKCKSTRKAAELLCVSQSTIMRKIKENNLDFPG